MTARIQQVTNTNDVSTTPTAIAIDSTTAVTVLPARTPDTPIIRASIFNSGNKTFWLRNYSSTVDNLKIGEPILPAGRLVLELPNIGVDEWSGLFDSGVARDIYVSYI